MPTLLLSDTQELDPHFPLESEGHDSASELVELVVDWPKATDTLTLNAWCYHVFLLAPERYKILAARVKGVTPLRQVVLLLQPTVAWSGMFWPQNLAAQLFHTFHAV